MYIRDLDTLVADALSRLNSEDPVAKGWRTGDLSYKVMEHQTIIKDKLGEVIKGDPQQRVEPYVLNCSRRFGKTTMILLTFVEECIKYPGHVYLFVAPTEEAAKEIVLSVMPVIIADAPDTAKPKFRNGRYTFPNGSVIKLGSAHNGGESLRGRSANGAAIDEGAFVKKTRPDNGLIYVMNSVIRPQLLTTQGWFVVASTPPPQLAHEYVELYNQARALNRMSQFSIYDNTSITEQLREAIKAKEYALDPSGSSWKREYLAEFAVDSRSLIISNWDTEEMTGTVDRPVRFEIYDRYVAYDHGTTDLSVFLFGYWHWEHGTLVVEKELVVGLKGEKLTTRELDKVYRICRQDLWQEMEVRREVCDAINPQLIIDFNRDFGNRFVAPLKTNLEAMVNQLTNLVGNKQILINKDQCPLLIQTLEQATWKTSASGKREFARLPGIGHCDALASLIYLARTVDRHHNPHDYATDVPAADDVFVVKRQDKHTPEVVFAKAFNMKPQGANRNRW